MNCYTVSFFGHRIIKNFPDAEKSLEKIIHSLLREKEYVVFLVGRDGDFDQIVSSTVRHYKRTIRDDNCSLVWVMPYLTADYKHNETFYKDYYDEIEVYENKSYRHFKAAFQARNKYMVERSDLVVFYIDHNNGGAYQTMRYTQKKNISYINIYVEGTMNCGSSIL